MYMDDEKNFTQNKKPSSTRDIVHTILFLMETFNILQQQNLRKNKARKIGFSWEKNDEHDKYAST